MKEEIDFRWNGLFFAFLVCAFYKEPIVVSSDFDCSYFKNYFGFFKQFKVSDSSNKAWQLKINLKKLK